MKTRPNSGSSSDAQENVFWTTMSDLMLGLAIIFMTLFVLAMTGYSQSKVQSQNNTSDVAKNLNSQFKTANVNATVDRATGVVKIADVELFSVGSAELTPRGKAYLDKFMPLYINTIFGNDKINDKIVNIIIQGHTDSQMFAGISSKDEQFIKNMDLSTRRANAVASYIFKTPYKKTYSNDLRKMLVVEGKSFTEPVLVNGVEDFSKSRRVELKFIVRDTNVKDYFLGGVK